MKRIMLIILCLVLFCSCGVNSDDTNNAQSETFSASITENETSMEFSEDIPADTEENPLALLAEYKSENTFMSAISEIAAAQLEENPERINDTVELCQFVYADVNGDCKNEIAMIFPDGNACGYALYIILNSGQMTKLSLENSNAEVSNLYAEISVMSDNDNQICIAVYSSATERYDENDVCLKKCRRYYDHSNALVNTISARTEENDETTVYKAEIDGQTVNGDYNDVIRRYEKNNGVNRIHDLVMMDMREYLSEPQRLEEYITEKQSLTPLDNVKKQVFADSMLYDFTGDGFPERLTFGYGLEAEFTIADMSRGYPCTIASGLFEGEIYLCEDEQIRFIAWEEEFGHAHMFEFSAERCDFYDSVAVQTELGRGEVCYDHWDSDLSERYNSALSFQGTELAPMKMYNHRGGWETEDEAWLSFHSAFEEYISRYTIIDIIRAEMNEDGEFVSENITEEFAEAPQHCLIKNRCAYSDEETIIICGRKYPLSSTAIEVDLSADKDFDFSVLNGFNMLESLTVISGENRSVMFEQNDWCGKIKQLTIHADNI
ncbi:MAG: hypothetical protein IJ368_01900, partial [Oscillospiraceae bacterium]|nr:hypothetical protein [Oscillospiraceae bacterium]